MALPSLFDRFVRFLLYIVIAACIFFLILFLFIGYTATRIDKSSPVNVTQRAIAERNPHLCSEIDRFNICLPGLCPGSELCLLEVAVALEDYAICDLIAQTRPETKMDCILSFNGKGAAADDCLKIYDADAQGRCVAGMEADFSACDILENNNAIWRCYQLNIDRMDAPSPTLCDELYADKDVRTFDPKKMCYSVLAKKISDPFLCEKLPTRTGVDGCQWELKNKMTPEQIARFEPFGYEFFPVNGFRIRIPSAWKAVSVPADDTRYDFIDRKTNERMAELVCPILEVGYEAWDITVEERGLSDTLWMGEPKPGTSGLDPLRLLLIKNLDGDFAHTCQVRFFSGVDLQTIRNIWVR